MLAAPDRNNFETAAGKQPVEVVRTMAEIVETTERAQRTGTARNNSIR